MRYNGNAKSKNENTEAETNKIYWWLKVTSGTVFVLYLNPELPDARKHFVCGSDKEIFLYTILAVFALYDTYSYGSNGL